MAVVRAWVEAVTAEEVAVRVPVVVVMALAEVVAEAAAEKSGEMAAASGKPKRARACDRSSSKAPRVG